MLTKRLTAAAAALFMSAGLASVGHAGNALLPGSPANLDPFRVVFDEYGTAYYQTWLGSSYGSKNIIKPIAGAPYLTWALPEPVISGDVSFAEPPNTKCTGASDCSDGLRFLSVNGTSYMSFFSDPGESNVPADTGFPSGFDFTSWQFMEIGPEAGPNGFTYAAGPGPEGLTNFYVGISDYGAVPELGTWAMMALGFAGLAFAGYRTTKAKAALA